MQKNDIDFSFLNEAIKEDTIAKSKEPVKPSTVTDTKIQALMHDVQILAENKIPLDIKGNRPDLLLFQIDDISHLTQLIEAMEKNNTFKGRLEIKSNKFTDNLGLKIANIILNNSLKSLIIDNQSKPFSDRVATVIGDALEKNTSLIEFLCFFDVGEISPVHLIKFLTNSKSKLQNFGYMKITKKLFETITEYLNKGCHVHVLNFYYVPLKEVNLLYKKEIEQDVLDKLANAIENESYITDINVISLDKEFKIDINEKLTKDIEEIVKTLKFSCKIVDKRQKSLLHTDEIFIKQNKFIDTVLEKIDRKDSNEDKNSIISVRSYLDRVIGESLNQALYNLDVQRERFPDKKELFTAKGSIKYIAQYLLDNKE